MNYLAHFFLSANNPEVLVGNFIGDHVKGNSYTDYSVEIQKGILLHRFIDHFTDTHPVFRMGTKRLQPTYRKFGPVIMDVFYDHFLAVDWHLFTTISKTDFIRDSYNILIKQEAVMPEIDRFIIAKMSSEDWLGSYHTLEGIQQILTRMSNRSRFDNNMHHAASSLMQDYEIYRQEFHLFFPDLVRASSSRLAELSTNLGA